MLSEVLDASVRAATGIDEASARPAQREMADAIHRVIVSGEHMVVRAGTGTGKSLAYLAPALWAAANEGARTVISTESLSLQAQIVDKDAPAVVGAVKAATGKDVKVALLKGWSNYVCARACLYTLGRDRKEEITSLDEALRVVRRKRAKEWDLLKWAIEQACSPSAPGDRASYPGAVDEAQWAGVSVSTSECTGQGCPFADVCKARLAREDAMEADVIVTNHTLLAIQAAKSIPLIVSSKKLGRVDALIVDEAHQLASQIRSQGAGEVSGQRLRRIAHSLERVMFEDGSGVVSRTFEDLVSVARLVDERLDAMLAQGDGRIPPDADPTASFAPAVERVLDAASTVVGRVADKDLRAARLTTRIGNALADLKAAACGGGVARWVEKNPVVRLAFSPVDVSGMARAALYTDRRGEEETPVAVVATSATLPAGFAAEVGLSPVVVQDHPSPFDEAYAASALYVPRLGGDKELVAPGGRFDLAAHRAWAADEIADLVRANEGRALVLAATAESGRLYASHLRERLPELVVLDQWCGEPVRQLIARWRENECSVMVGTRSMMTGVDAAGETCSLVVIDRVPRSSPNPVDDARVEAVRLRAELDRWSADRAVYVRDAALLLEQAKGRLIRRTTDSGMVAVLDPRLLRRHVNGVAYPEPTRRTYLAALGEDWGERITSRDRATEWLRERRQRPTRVA